MKVSGSLQPNETITLYELNDGKRDSSFIQISDVNPSFTIFPVDDYVDNGLHSRQFIIRHKNKLDTIHSIVATFEDVTIVCDSRWGCGRGLGGKNTKTTLRKLAQFSFVARGKSYGLNETVVLD